MSVKGKGFIGYLDVDSDDAYVQIPCVKVAKPSGRNRGIVESEVCLGDTEVEQDTGDLKRTPMTLTIYWSPLQAGISDAIETAIEADTEVQMALKLPFTTPVYEYYVGKFSNAEPDNIVRDQKLSMTVEFLPTAAPTRSTTAPTLES